MEAQCALLMTIHTNRDVLHKLVVIKDYQGWVHVDQQVLQVQDKEPGVVHQVVGMSARK